MQGWNYHFMKWGNFMNQEISSEYSICDALEILVAMSREYVLIWAKSLEEVTRFVKILGE